MIDFVEVAESSRKGEGELAERAAIGAEVMREARRFEEPVAAVEAGVICGGAAVGGDGQRARAEVHRSAAITGHLVKAAVTPANLPDDAEGEEHGGGDSDCQPAGSRSLMTSRLFGPLVDEAGALEALERGEDYQLISEEVAAGLTADGVGRERGVSRGIAAVVEDRVESGFEFRTVHFQDSALDMASGVRCSGIAPR